MQRNVRARLSRLFLNSLLRSVRGPDGNFKVLYYLLLALLLCSEGWIKGKKKTLKLKATSDFWISFLFGRSVIPIKTVDPRLNLNCMIVFG